MTTPSFIAARDATARLRRIARAITFSMSVLSVSACGGSDGATEPPVPPVSGITIAPQTLVLLAGATGALGASVSPAAANSAMTWTSDAPSIATVSGSGTSATVTAIAAGTATIRATSSSNAAIWGAVTVTVATPVVVALTLSSTSLTLVPGQPATSVATARDANGVTVQGADISWTSSASVVAIVGSDGRVTGVSPGNATITAHSGSASATVRVIVNDGGYATPGGGAITALGGALVLEVSAGSLAVPTAVTVRRSTDAPANARLLAGTAIEIASSVAFSVPPRLHLVYPSALSPDIVETQLRLARVSNGAWQESGVETVNRIAHLVTAPMTTSGTWAVFAPLPSLRSYAQLRGIDIGGATNIQELRADVRHVIPAEFNSTTPGNEMKWESIHPTPSTYSFGDADEIVNFAQANGMQVHGHTLLWHNQAPAWIQASTQTRSTILAALKGHIETVVGRYRGRVGTWDVANEVIADNQTGLRSTFWTSIGGADIIDSAFVWAKRTDPTAKLFLNDYSVETVNAKSDSLLAFASRLKARGVPIDGIGLQAHFLVAAPSRTQLKANFDRIAAAGFDIRVTELDVRLVDGADDLAAQATVYANVMEACRDQLRCRAVTTWGVSDAYSWIPSWFPGFGRGLLFDPNFQRKPAYTSLRDVLARP